MALIDLIHTFGVLGWFVVSFTSNTILPIPLEPMFFVVESVLGYPIIFLLAVASAGAAFGESTVYVIGRGTHRFADWLYAIYNRIAHRVGKKEKKRKHVHKIIKSKVGKKVHGMFKEWPFGAIIIGAFTPLPMIMFDLVAGYFRYDYKKFWFATFLGKMARYMVIFYAGSAFINYGLLVLR